MAGNFRVYIHTTPSRKKYVGITQQEPERRWQNGRGYTNNLYFSRAINKYGWKNITHTIVKSWLSLDDALILEKRLIEEYKTNKPEFGYNLTNGGEGGYGLKGIKNKKSMRVPTCFIRF